MVFRKVLDNFSIEIFIFTLDVWNVGLNVSVSRMCKYAVDMLHIVAVALTAHHGPRM